MSYSDNNPLSALGNTNNSNNIFSSFSNMGGYSKEFLESNSIIAKVAFLLLVLIVTMFVLQIMKVILGWIFGTSDNVLLIDGMKSAKNYLEITQDPRMDGSKTIRRSKNEDGGIEFTWNVWLYIEDLEYGKGRKKHIFHKGSKNMNSSSHKHADIAYPNNAPGLYLHETENALVVVMNTFDEIVEQIKIPNIPLNKWINVSIRVKNINLDVYVNNNIVSRHILNSPPKQNYSNVFVNMNNGFSGHISNLQYFSKALTGMEIVKLVRAGPNLKQTEKKMFTNPPYFSMRWYFNEKELI